MNKLFAAIVGGVIALSCVACDKNTKVDENYHKDEQGNVVKEKKTVSHDDNGNSTVKYEKKVDKND